MGCAIGLGLALGSMERYPGVEGGIARTALGEDVGLADLGVAVEHTDSEAGLALVGRLGRDCGSGCSGLVGSLGPPTGCRCGWRP